MKLWKYILIGVVSAAAFLAAFAFLKTLLNPEKTFADGFKGFTDYVLAVCFGGSLAWTFWKKENDKGGDK